MAKTKPNYSAYGGTIKKTTVLSDSPSTFSDGGFSDIEGVKTPKTSSLGFSSSTIGKTGESGTAGLTKSVGKTSSTMSAGDAAGSISSIAGDVTSGSGPGQIGAGIGTAIGAAVGTVILPGAGTLAGAQIGSSAGKIIGEIVNMFMEWDDAEKENEQARKAAEQDFREKRSMEEKQAKIAAANRKMEFALNYKNSLFAIPGYRERLMPSTQTNYGV